MIFQEFYSIKSSISRGMMLVDIMVAFAVALLSILSITQSSLYARGLFDRTSQRNSLLTDFEMHRNELNVLPYQSGTLSLSSSTISVHGLPYGNDRIENDFEVSSWSQKIQFTAIRADPSNDSSGAALCSVNFQGGVSSAIPIIKAIQLPINPLIPLTDLEVRDGLAYVSADSSNPSDPDVFILNLNTSALLSSIDTGPGISAIALSGRRIYTAAASTAAQLHVIRMDSLDRLVLESKYKLPPPYAIATPPFSSSIFYHKGLVYLGTEKWDGPEFVIIKIGDSTAMTQNPPVQISNLEIGSKVNGIYERNGIAYAASSDQNQLHIIDVHDQNHPVLLNSFSPSGWERQEGKALSFFENGLAFGRTSGGFDIKSDHELFSWATTSLVSLENQTSTNVPGGIYGIVQDRLHTYAVSRESDREFRISDYKLSASSTAYYSLPVSPQTITCDGDKLYILAHSAPVIYEITFKK